MSVIHSMEMITVFIFATRHVKIILNTITYLTLTTTTDGVLHLASVTNSGDVAVGLKGFIPDSSLPRSSMSLVITQRNLMHYFDLTCGFCITRWSFSPSRSLGFHVGFVLGVFHFLSARFNQLPSSKRFLIFCRYSCGPGISALVLALARTIGDDRDKLVSDLPSTRLLAFDVHNLSHQVLSV